MTLQYWSFRYEIVVIDGIAKKRRRIIILAFLQKKALDQLDVNHMGTEKTRLPAQESIYLINMNADIDNAIKIVPYINFQATQPKIQHCHMRYQKRPWESVTADIFSINNKHYPCIVNYHNTFLVIKQV